MIGSFGHAIQLLNALVVYLLIWTMHRVLESSFDQGVMGVWSGSWEQGKNDGTRTASLLQRRARARRGFIAGICRGRSLICRQVQ